VKNKHARTPRKLCFFASLLYPIANREKSGFGGAELELWNVAQAFGRRDQYDVQVLTVTNAMAGSRKFGAVELTAVAGTGPLTYKDPWFKRRISIWKFFIRLFTAARRERADLYFTKLASSEATTIWLASRFAKAPFVFKIEHDWETSRDTLTRIVFRGSRIWANVFLYALKRAELVFVQTEKQQQALKRNFGISSILIANGHSMPPEDQIGRKLPERKCILWAGRGHPMKRPLLFVEMARNNPDLLFCMIMSPNPEHQAMFNNVAAQAAEVPNLTFIPGVEADEMNSYYQDAKLFVLTSDAEGFSNVLIEAMKNGVPVLSLTHNPDGMLQESAQVSDIAPAPGFYTLDSLDVTSRTMHALLADEHLWMQCHLMARELVLRRFGLDAVTDQYVAAFNDLAANGAAETSRFAEKINRQRIRPRLIDYSYLNLRGNYKTMLQFASMVGDGAKILDAGCGFKPWESCFNGRVTYYGVDYSAQWSAPDSIASLDDLPFADNTFDAIICSEVIEHTRYPERCIAELRRVCKPGGLLYISTPFCFPEHGIPYDFQRLTQYFYKDVFKHDELIRLHASSSTLGTAFTTFNFFVECTPLRLVWGLGPVTYFINNSLGLLCDGLINFFAPKIMRTLPLYTHMLPLGYSMIVRVKSDLKA